MRSKFYFEFVILILKYIRFKKEMLLFDVKYLQYDKMFVDFDDMVSLQ